jgi:arsenate reductase
MDHRISPLMRKCIVATVAELSDEFRGIYSHDTVVRYVEESYAAVANRPTVGPNFLPVIIARFTHERLWAAAQTDGRIEKVLPELLFVCRHDAGRSQIAAAVAHHLSNGWVGVRSAGSEPVQQLEPAVVTAMDELSIDLAQEFPKPLTEEVVRAADVVVTLGCGDACPVYPGRRYEDWTVSDPAGQPLSVVRQIRYELYHRVWGLIDSLVPSANLLALQ